MNVICLESFYRSLLAFLSFVGSIISSLFKGCLGEGTLIEIERGVLLTNWLDEILLIQVLDESSGNRSTDLEFLAKESSGDAEDLWDLLEHSLVLLLIEENGVVKLFLNLDLGPGLLLSGFTLTFCGLSIFGCTRSGSFCTYLCLLSLFNNTN